MNAIRIRRGVRAGGCPGPAGPGTLFLAIAVLFSVAIAAGPICAGAAPNAESPKGPSSGLRTLTTAKQAHSLSDDQAKRGYPVHLRGVITYFDPDFGTGLPAIFIHDATGGIFIRMACEHSCKAAESLFVGALVDVTGVSAPGGFGPIVGDSQVRVVGRAPLPPDPPQVSLDLIKTGAEDAQWVEVEGSVVDVVDYGHGKLLHLEMADGPMMILMIKTPGASFSHLVDSVVRVRGNVAPSMTSDGQMIGFHIHSPSLSALRVVQPAPSDPFAERAIPIDRLLHREVYSSSPRRIHLRGSVTLQWPGSLLCIRDATRGVCAQTTQATSVAVGDQVDVAGFVESLNYIPVMTEAVFRRIGSGPPAGTHSVTADKILGGGFASDLIQIDGQLIGYDLTSSDAILQLSSGDTLFPAILPKSLAGSEVRAWKIGSRLRVTGICSLSGDAQSNVRAGVIVPQSFRVLMRSPADVTIIEQPSWWTPAHATLLLALALTVTLAVLGWVVILRRRVEHQADLLRESEQQFRHMALHDALTGLATRLLLQDRLDIAFANAKRRNRGLAVLMVDLDRFKEINDSFGHPAGDEVLRVTANRLLQAVRAEDTVARLGGDEFVVLLQDLTDLHVAKEIAAIIVGTLAIPIQVDGCEVPVSATVGVCALAASECNADDLMKNADTALYRAKEDGRNRFQVFAPEAAGVPAASASAMGR